MHQRLLFVKILLLFVFPVFAQEKVVSRKQFFLDTAAIEVVIKTDLKKLTRQKKEPNFQPAQLTWKNADSSGDVKESIRIRLRGNNRRENCNLASLMIDFRVDGQQSRLKNLKEMKWVAPCMKNIEGEQFVIKEYLIYKMYNLLTDKSFRVRLLHITFEDEMDKQKGASQYGFAIEHIDDLTDRVGYAEEKQRVLSIAQTNVYHTILVSVFQYMIGNTDWSIPNYHNVKLLVPKDSLLAFPYIVPYDFDFAGAVNAPYAVPDESRGIEKVTDRKYIGLSRPFDLVKDYTNQFMAQKDNINKLVLNCSLLNTYHKKEMANFIGSFFKILESDSSIKYTFVDNAKGK